MIENLTQLAQQALEALEYHQQQTRPIERTQVVIAALRRALPKQCGKTCDCSAQCGDVASHEADVRMVKPTMTTPKLTYPGKQDELEVIKRARELLQEASTELTNGHMNPATGKIDEPEVLAIIKQHEAVIASLSAMLVWDGQGEQGEPVAWVGQDDPRCNDGGKACIDCLCIGKCLHRAQPAPTAIPPEVFAAIDAEQMARAREKFGDVPAPAVPADVAKNAARYVWLRDVSVPPHNFYLSVPDEFDGVKYKPSEVDAYIDAAIAAKPGGAA